MGSHRTGLLRGRADAGARGGGNAPVCQVPVAMRVVVVAGLVAAARAIGHACDDEHGRLCPEHGPTTLGGCLRAQRASLSDGCGAWVAMHDACEAELGGYCARACDGETCGFANEAVACLTMWMDQADVSAECRAMFPPPPVKVERVRSAKSMARSAARKAAREKAAEKVRRLNAGLAAEAEDGAAEGGPRAALPSGDDL